MRSHVGRTCGLCCGLRSEGQGQGTPSRTAAAQECRVLGRAWELRSAAAAPRQARGPTLPSGRPRRRRAAVSDTGLREVKGCGPRPHTEHVATVTGQQGRRPERGHRAAQEGAHEASARKRAHTRGASGRDSRGGEHRRLGRARAAGLSAPTEATPERPRRPENIPEPKTVPGPTEQRLSA